MAKPNKYEALGIAKRLESIEGWAKEGLTDKELAEKLGVSRQTIFAWKGKYPEFSKALETGATEANGEILNSAFRQACGYTITVKEVIKTKTERIDPTTGRLIREEIPQVVEYEKYFEPNPQMTRFMLMNRLPEKYKDKPVAAEDKTIVVTHFIPDGDMNAEYND